MAQQELEAALRREGELKSQAIWHRVETEAEQVRNETRQSLERQRQSELARRQGQMNARHETELAAARKQAQRCRLSAEAALEERLKGLSQGLLKQLAEAGGSPLFQALADEIPAYPWQRVKVHPRDSAAAARAFPGAEILANEEISAGLEVQSSDDRIRIINSLEKRLEHFWPELLPELFNEIRPQTGDEEIR